jgi:dienelactone hydrolase
LHLLAAVAAASPLWVGLEPGPYRVGFEQMELHDYSRPYRSTEIRARPITLSIWYPAAEVPEGTAPLEFRRYVGSAAEDDFRRRLSTYGFKLSSDEIESLLASRTEAFEKAARAVGPFPLLVIGGSLTGPFYLNTVLAEYLASQGYVAAALTALPAREGDEADFDLRAVDVQMRDMEFAIQALHDYPEASIERIGLAAWSFGGVPQALLAMKNPDVTALVSLDAATGYAYGQKLLEESLYYEPGRATAALFHATDSRESGQVPKSFVYYDETAKGSRYFLELEGATHAEFSSLAIVPRTVSGDDSSEVFRRYRLLCLYVSRFLDAAIKNDASARAFLDVAPTRHGFEGVVLSRKR